MRGFLQIARLIGLIVLVSACGDQDEVEDRRQLGVAEDCDAAVTTCFVRDGEVIVSLGMGPGVTPLKPYPLTLVVKGATNAVEEVVIDFQMQGMDMGNNRYRLQPQLDDSWHGTVILPVCVASRMDWRAIAEFTLEGEPVQVVFLFHSEAD